MKRPPWKLALIAFGATLAVGLVAGAALTAAHPGGDMEARGEAFGYGLGLLATAIAGIVLVVALARQRQERTGGAVRDAAGEPLLAEASGGLFKGSLRMYPARFELTPTRLRCYQRSVVGAMFGLVGAIATQASRGTLAVDLELGRIAGLARGKIGLNRRVLDVTTVDGARHRFAIDRFDAWSAALRAAIAAGGRRVVDLGDDRWEVAAV